MEETTKNNHEEKLAELEKQRDEYLNNWKRAAADLINYKKEEMERVAMLMQYGKEDMVEKILPIFDNFYLSAKQLPQKLKDGKEGSVQSIEWTRGFLQIQKQVEDFLKKEGIEEIETVGKPFEVATMEAVGELDGEFGIRNSESGMVVEELQKGYKIGGKVLRPAKVKISK